MDQRRSGVAGSIGLMTALGGEVDACGVVTAIPREHHALDGGRRRRVFELLEEALHQGYCPRIELLLVGEADGEDSGLVGGGLEERTGGLGGGPPPCTEGDA